MLVYINGLSFVSSTRSFASTLIRFRHTLLRITTKYMCRSTVSRFHQPHAACSHRPEGASSTPCISHRPEGTSTTRGSFASMRGIGRINHTLLLIDGLLFAIATRTCTSTRGQGHINHTLLRIDGEWFPSSTCSFTSTQGRIIHTLLPMDMRTRMHPPHAPSHRRSVVCIIHTLL